MLTVPTTTSPIAARSMNAPPIPIDTTMSYGRPYAPATASRDRRARRGCGRSDATDDHIDVGSARVAPAASRPNRLPPSRALADGCRRSAVGAVASTAVTTERPRVMRPRVRCAVLASATDPPERRPARSRVRQSGAGRRSRDGAIRSGSCAGSPVVGAAVDRGRPIEVESGWSASPCGSTWSAGVVLARSAWAAGADRRRHRDVLGAGGGTSRLRRGGRPGLDPRRRGSALGRRREVLRVAGSPVRHGRTRPMPVAGPACRRSPPERIAAGRRRLRGIRSGASAARTSSTVDAAVCRARRAGPCAAGRRPGRLGSPRGSRPPAAMPSPTRPGNGIRPTAPPATHASMSSVSECANALARTCSGICSWIEASTASFARPLTIAVTRHSMITVPRL